MRYTTTNECIRRFDPNTGIEKTSSRTGTGRVEFRIGVDDGANIDGSRVDPASRALVTLSEALILAIVKVVADLSGCAVR